MNAEEAQKMLDDLAHMDSDEMDFMVTREDQTPGRTISAEALDEFRTAIDAFIYGRLMYHWNRKPGGRDAVGPSVIRAEVRLTVDDVHIVPKPDARPWYVIDGGTRLDA